MAQHWPADHFWLKPMAVPPLNCISRWSMRGSLSFMQSHKLTTSKAYQFTSLHGSAAVHDEGLPGHHGGVAGEKSDSVGDVVGGRGTLEGRDFDGGSDHVLMVGEPAGNDGPGADGVDADVRGKGFGERLRHGDQAAFGSGIGDRAARAGDACDGSHINDRAAAAGTHQRNSGAGDEERAFEIDGEY